MSEFQLSLLTIGIIVVAGVYSYGHLQQWRYRRSHGTTSKTQSVEPSPRTSPTKVRPTEAPGGNESDALAEPKAASNASAADAICGLLSEATDHVVTFLLKAPLTPGMLEALWQRRFDFGKSIHACGLNNVSGLWERLIPESEQTYRAFRIGLQLVDRSGSVSEMRLAGFHDLLAKIAEQLQVEAELPSIEETLRRAQELDRFCADVDQMIGISLLTTGGRKLSGGEVAIAAERLGMTLQADGAFHRTDEGGATLFVLGASDGTLFHHHTLNQLRLDSLTLLLDIPRATEPVRCFDEMVALAHELAKTLRTTMADDQRVALSDGSVAQIRAQVAATQEMMLAGHVMPGSAQALRLFS
jgi:ZipA, C-terminal FtsZ-binding domain